MGRREGRGWEGEREGGGDGRLGGEDERRDTKEKLGIWEDQRLSGMGEKVKRKEGRVESVSGRTERKMDGGVHKENIM